MGELFFDGTGVFSFAGGGLGGFSTLGGGAYDEELLLDFFEGLLFFTGVGSLAGAASAGLF